MSPNPGDFLMVREEVFWTLLGTIGVEAVLLVVSLLVMWTRVGRIRADLSGTLTQLQALLMKSQGVNLSETLEAVRSELKHLLSRVESLEQERATARSELLDTNERVLKAMTTLRDDLLAQRKDIVLAVTAEVQAQNDAHIRRVTRDEFFKLTKEKE